MEVSNQLNQRRQSASTSMKPPEDKTEKNPKRHKQNGNVVDVMEKYIELRLKQAEEEMARDREATKQVDEFSIKNCIVVLSTMKELSPEENAHAFKPAMGKLAKLIGGIKERLTLANMNKKKI
uniref:Uncharacterized protein n=1 Tax=Oryza punctata TaxID=4537 RepID=A0A0E0KEL6_ORYPU